ncbi:uncharacterized protein LOC127711530 [Mytilus californianus]|uniref:uncharacterized protein LOC127711530 n=1 Tax=Mytilus californianus TaxID=6549 RepID=UPI002246C853|nr:uncharacterized protein LOC127711530 [Mytilus californianus]
MESRPVCEPCTAQEKSSVAIKLCSDCEEKLCKNCVEDHSKFKAFRSHHLIDLSSVGSKLPSFAKHCDLHKDSLLDFYCSQHSVACCRSCIPLNHQTCKDVLPIEVASRNIKDSAILQDTLGDVDNVLKSLIYLMENRDNNIKKFVDSEPVILTQVKKVKDQIMQVDKLEGNIIKDLSCMKQRHETRLNEEKNEITMLITEVLEGKNQIEFLQEHGSNNQLFLAVQQQENKVQAVESRIEKMTATFIDTELTFNVVKYHEIGSIGSVTETIISCKVQHKPLKLKQAQANPESTKPITSIKRERELHLKTGESYNLTGITVTNANKLLLCNYFDSNKYCYIYNNCDGYETSIEFSSIPYDVEVLPKDDMAVVTLPNEKSLQYINTKTTTKCNKIATAEECYGVCTSRNNIFLGGIGNVYILDLEGSFVRKIITQYSEKIYSICFSESSQQVICRNKIRLLGLKLEGDVVYSHSVNGESGLALDVGGNVYYSDETLNRILRLSSDGNYKFGIPINDKGNRPNAIAFNKSFTKLFIISRFESVQIYSCC